MRRFERAVAAEEGVIIGVRNLGRVIGMIERAVVRDLGRERGERCGGVFVGFGQGGHAQALRKRERVIKLLERFDLPSLQLEASTNPPPIALPATLPITTAPASASVAAAISLALP